MKRPYCLISPCRDEEKYIRDSIESIVRQSIQPALWIIVDDGSTDNTPTILNEYAKRFDFIQILRLQDRGFRKLGGGVIDAFYAGYELIGLNNFEYICKLDLDLILPERYFEKLIDKMEKDPRIGTCSGKPYFYGSQRQLISEKCGDENSVGMTKFYRVDCFRRTGGFVRALMWDGIDGHRCRMLGWIAISWDDPEIRFIHLRPMGSSDKNWWIGRVRHGRGQYFMGTIPLYMLVSAIYRMTRPPFLIGGLAMLYGYFSSLVTRQPRYADPKFREFLRNYQWNCLLLGKVRATRKTDEKQASQWKSNV